MGQRWIGQISHLLKQFLVLATMKKCRTGLQIIQEIIGGLGRVAGLNHSSCSITFHLVSFEKHALKIGFYLGEKCFYQSTTNSPAPSAFPHRRQDGVGAVTQADCVNSLIPDAALYSCITSWDPAVPVARGCFLWSVLGGGWGRGEVCKARAEAKCRDLHLCHVILQELMA